MSHHREPPPAAESNSVPVRDGGAPAVVLPKGQPTIIAPDIVHQYEGGNGNPGGGSRNFRKTCVHAPHGPCARGQRRASAGPFQLRENSRETRARGADSTPTHD